MSQLFLFFYQLFQKRRPMFLLGIALSFAALGYLSSRLHLAEDISRMVPQRMKVGGSYQALESSKSFEKIFVNISLTDPSLSSGVLKDFADSLALKLLKDSVAMQRITKIRAKIPDQLLQESYGFFIAHLPLFLQKEDYERIGGKLKVENVQQNLQNGLKWVSLPSSGPFRKYFLEDPLFIAPLALEKFSQLSIDDRYQMQDGYLVSKKGNSVLIIIQPKYPTNEIGQNTVLLNQLDQSISDLEKQFQQAVSAEYFGAPAVAVCNSKQIRKDLVLTSFLSLFLISLTIWAYYRQLSVAIILFVPVVFGLLFAAGAMWCIKGEISILALASGAIVFGIIIDYSTHFFSHLKHTGSITQTIKDISLPMVIGNISTVGAFASLLFVDSQVLNDFGLFSALSLVGGLFFTLLVLPHIAPAPSTKRETRFAKILDKIGKFKPEENKWIVRFALFFSIACFLLYDKVGFEENLGALNYISKDLMEAQEHLFEKEAETERNIVLMFKGNTLEQALQKAEEGAVHIQHLQNSGKVGSFANPTFLLPSWEMQKTNIKQWETYWTQEKRIKLAEDFKTVSKRLGIKSGVFDPYVKNLSAQISPLNPSEIDFLKREFLADFITDNKGETSIMSNIKAPHQNSTFVNEYLSQHTSASVLDKQYLASKFVAVVKDNFNQLLAMSSILVFGILLLSYGRIELALITFLPMLLSWIWILGIMVLLGIEFNIVNIIISTFIFGLGDDFSIFIMDGLQKKYAKGKDDLDSFKAAIFISMLTTLLGIGVMIFAQHPALHSIALISVVGILCAMWIAFLFIPLLFHWMITRRTERGLAPMTLLGLIRSAFAFVYYISGCLLLTLLGILLFKVLRMNKLPWAKYFYHCLMMFTSRLLMRMMFIVKMRFLNPYKERFQKPVIIVANHQSFLDILCILILHPKLIFFTNNWVWNSPFFGKMVQMADFYPIEHGVEKSLELVRRKTMEGYSVVIFPEGTRSNDGSIKRFHKGAFYLAEKLNLDILPIVLHGTGHCMPKNDFLLSKGILTVQFLARIPPSDIGYHQVSKETAQLFRVHYHAFNTPAYFRYRLMQNYIFKGPILEWYTRIKVALEKDYVLFDKHLPSNGLIYDLGCGYGYMSHLLSWTASGRQFIGVDYDGDKIETAQQISSYAHNTPRFVTSDLKEFKVNACEAIILSDVLHYMDRISQQKLLDKCLLALRPNGVLLLRDGDMDHEKNHQRTKWTELLSTQILGFNKTTAPLEFVSLKEISDYIHSQDFYHIEVVEKSAITSNTVLKITKAPMLSS